MVGPVDFDNKTKKDDSVEERKIAMKLTRSEVYYLMRLAIKNQESSKTPAWIDYDLLIEKLQAEWVRHIKEKVAS